MDKAEADAALARLQRAERAHGRNQNALSHALTRHEDDITRLTALVGDIEAAIGRRQDTRGDKFRMTVDGRAYAKRAEAGQRLKQLLLRETASMDGVREKSAQPGHLGGFPVKASIWRALGAISVELSLDGAPGSSIRLPEHEVSKADPGGLVTRLENRLARLEELKASTLADIGRAHREIAHAQDSIGKPFPQAGQLAAARERAHQIDEELGQMAAPPQASDQAGKEPSAESMPAGAAGAATREAGPAPAAARSDPAPHQKGGAMSPIPAAVTGLPRLQAEPDADPEAGSSWEAEAD